MKRVIFYFDGFNFYFGLKERSEQDRNWKNYYWIDFVKFCNQFIQKESELQHVKYFTAPPTNNGERSRQSALFTANKLLNPDKFTIYNGQYQDKSIDCRKCKQPFLHPEEKRTDVNISVNMLMDCFQNNADTLILVSADSDQIPTVQAIKKYFPQKTIKVYFPPNRNSAELFALCKPIVFLENNEDKFKAAIMPTVVSSETKNYTKPENWKP